MICMLSSYYAVMTERNRTATVLVVLLVSLLSLSAIAMPVSADRNTTVDYEIDVTEDGDVETIDVRVASDEATYDEWERVANYYGFDSFAEYLGSSFAEDEPGLNDYTAEERDLEDGREAHVQFTDVNVSEAENMSVTADDGTVRWETTDVDEMDDDDEFDEVTYTVDMPGDVTDSNAMSVSDGTAVWELHEENPDELYAEATVSDESDDGQSDEDDGQSDESEDSVPGLGVGTALVALIATALLARRAD